MPQTFAIEKITFMSDGFRLTGALHLPAVRHPPLIVGSHGLMSSGESPKQIALARRCNELGMAFFRFNHRGCLDSQGDFRKDTTFESRRRDLECAVEAVRSKAGFSDRLGLFGSSLGGAVCLHAAASLSVQALVVTAAPIRNRAIADDAAGRGTLEVDPEFYRNHIRFDLSEALAAVSRVLIFHGDQDEIVPVSSGLEIYAEVGEPKKLVVLPEGDHLMSRGDHQERFIREAGLWFERFLIPGHEAEIESKRPGGSGFQQP